MYHDFLLERTRYHFVYALVNVTNGVAFYVGQSKQPRMRLKNHVSSRTKYSDYVKNAKIDVTHVGMVILRVCSSYDDAIMAERHYIHTHAATLTNPAIYDEVENDVGQSNMVRTRSGAEAGLCAGHIPFVEWTVHNIGDLLTSALCFERGCGFTHDGVLTRWTWDLVEGNRRPNIAVRSSTIDDVEVFPSADEPEYLEPRSVNTRNMLRRVRKAASQVNDPNDSPWWRAMREDASLRGSFRIPGTADAMVVGRIPASVAGVLESKFGSIEAALAFAASTKAER